MPDSANNSHKLLQFTSIVNVNYKDWTLSAGVHACWVGVSSVEDLVP